MIFQLVSLLSLGENFTVPGTHVVKVEKPGKYGIWNVVSEFRAGVQRDYTEKLPNGTRIRVTDTAGEEISTTADLNCTETFGDSTRKSVCIFEANEAGSYSIIVDGITEERSLMVRRCLASNVVALFFLGGLMVTLGWIAPILISVLVEIKRYNAKKESANQQAQRTFQTPPRLV